MKEEKNGFKQNMRGIKDKIKNNVKNVAAIKGYLLYFHDFENKVAKLYSLPKIPPVIRIKEYGELVQMGNPSFYIEDKEVYIAVRKVPYSNKFTFQKRPVTEISKKKRKELNDDLKQLSASKFLDKYKIGKEKIKDIISEELLKKGDISEIEIKNINTREYDLVEEGFTAPEIDAKIFSIYKDRTFRPKVIDKKFYIIFVLSVLFTAVLVGFITYMLTRSALKKELKEEVESELECLILTKEVLKIQLMLGGVL